MREYEHDIPRFRSPEDFSSFDLMEMDGEEFEHRFGYSKGADIEEDALKYIAGVPRNKVRLASLDDLSAENFSDIETEQDLENENLGEAIADTTSGIADNVQDKVEGLADKAKGLKKKLSDKASDSIPDKAKPKGVSKLKGLKNKLPDKAKERPPKADNALKKGKESASKGKNIKEKFAKAANTSKKGPGDKIETLDLRRKAYLEGLAAEKPLKAYIKSLHTVNRGKMQRTQINLLKKAIDRKTKEKGIKVGSAEWVELVKQFFPEAPIKAIADSNNALADGVESVKDKVEGSIKEKVENLPDAKATNKDKSREPLLRDSPDNRKDSEDLDVQAKNEYSEDDISSKKDESEKENEDFMEDELAVATDKHPLKAEKDSEGRNVLSPIEDKSKDTGRKEKVQVSEESTDIKTKNLKGENKSDGKPNVKSEELPEVSGDALSSISAKPLVAPQLPEPNNAKQALVLNQAQSEESMIEEQEKAGNEEDIEAKATALKDNFRVKVELEKNKIKQQASLQRNILKANYAAETERINIDTETKKNELRANIRASKELIEAIYTEKVGSLKTKLGVDVERARLIETEKKEALKAEVTSRREAFAAYILEKEAAPAVFAKSEQGRIESELEAAAALCIQQSEEVAADYEEENPKNAALEVGRTGAKDIREKIKPMQENVMELAEELKGEYGQYKEEVDTKLNNVEEDLNPQIENFTESTVEQLNQSYDKTLEVLTQSKEKDIDSLSQLEKQDIGTIDRLKESAIDGINSNYTQGEDGLNMLERLLLEGIISYAQDINNSFEGEGDIYLPGVEDGLSQAGKALESMGATATSTLQGQSECSSEGIIQTSEDFSGKLRRTVEGSKVASTKLVESAKGTIEKIITANTEQSEKSLDKLATISQEIIDEGLVSVDEGIEEVKTKIEEQSKEIEDKIRETTNENIDKAKAPLYDDNKSRSEQAALEASKDSWWAGVGDAFMSLLFGLLVIVAIVCIIIMLAYIIFGLTFSFVAVLAVVGVVFLVFAIVDIAMMRWDQYKDDKLTFLGYIAVILYDVLGITSIYQAFSDKDIVTGEKLQLSQREKAAAFSMGAFSIILFCFGQRARLKWKWKWKGKGKWKGKWDGLKEVLTGETTGGVGDKVTGPGKTPAKETTKSTSTKNVGAKNTPKNKDTGIDKSSSKKTPAKDTKTKGDVNKSNAAKEGNKYKPGLRDPDLRPGIKPKTKNSTEMVSEWRRPISRSDISSLRESFLGEGFVKVDKGKWMSIDGTRMFRSVPDDFIGTHGMGMPTVSRQGHVHLEFLRKTPSANYVVTKNVHIPIK